MISQWNKGKKNDITVGWINAEGNLIAGYGKTFLKEYVCEEWKHAVNPAAVNPAAVNEKWTRLLALINYGRSDSLKR